MAGNPFTTASQSVASKVLNGGLNSTSGALYNLDSESTDLLNIDLNKFGSILKRNGYATCGTAGTKAIDGLHWYEYNSGGVTERKLVSVAGSKFWYNKSATLAGAFSDVTGSVASINSAYHCDFENFVNNVYCTNGTDTPFYWSGTGTCGVMTMPTNVVKPKYIRQFQNYLFIGNVAIGATDMPSRIYWSNIKDPGTWDADKFIEISKDDGQQITGMRVLGNNLVVYKERSIYNVSFTGDADFEFIMSGGGKSNSTVGCIAPWSIQEVENGHVFLAYDGLHYYDGTNSYKLSDKVSTSLGVDKINDVSIYFDPQYFSKAVSCVQRAKNRYFLALAQQTPNTSSTNNGCLVWDWYNNAFTVYDGLNPSAMTTVYLSGYDERPYFGDYSGWIYRMDSKVDPNNDYPLDVKTAINAYYYTNWKFFDDICLQKAVPHVYLYYQRNDATMTFSYSYDFENSDQYTQTFKTAMNVTTFDDGDYDITEYSGSGGMYSRRDLTGRGRLIRFKIANANLGETFRLDGIGSYVHAESNV